MSVIKLDASISVKFELNEKGTPPGQLATAELHFISGPLAGLKLAGFAIWEVKGRGRNITMPARQYSINGERRSFALLRPSADAYAGTNFRDRLLAAYAEFEELSAADPTA